MKQFNEFKKIVNKYGLQPISQREMPLLTLSCITQGYISLSRKNFGLSWKAIAAIGGHGKFHTMLNQKHITKKTGTFVKKNGQKLDKLIFNKTKNIFSNVAGQITNINSLVKKILKNALKK